MCLESKAGYTVYYYSEFEIEIKLHIDQYLLSLNQDDNLSEMCNLQSTGSLSGCSLCEGDNSDSVFITISLIHVTVVDEEPEALKILVGNWVEHQCSTRIRNKDQIWYFHVPSLHWPMWKALEKVR